MNRRVDYEAFWQGYWNDTTIHGPACRHRRRMVANLAQTIAHDSILDLGCGDGSLIAELKNKIPTEFEGSDISNEAFAIARKNAPGVHFYQLDLMSGSLNKTYDVVILSEVLEHIENDEHVLTTIAPNARHVVISVPGGPADKVDRRCGHFRNYTDKLLGEKLERCGYDVVRIIRWGFPFYDLQQHFAFREGEWGSETMSQGRYGWARIMVAKLVYLLYFMNSHYRGAQLFAVAKSRVASSR